MTARLLIFAIVTAPTLATAATTPDEAHQLLSDWQLEDALNAAQEMLVEDPENPELWYLAARIQHARGHHVSAVRLIDAAKAEGVDVDRLEPLAKGSADYQAWMEYVETDHFRIGYLNKDRIVAHYAGPVLEAAYKGIGDALDFYPAERGEKIAVEIYPDARGLSAATGLSLQAIETTGTIAVAKFHRLMIISPLATADGYAWGDTLSHEYTHLVISKKSRNGIPIWLHEGIAKYYEKQWSKDPGRPLGPWSEKLLADATRSGEFITFEQMHPSMALLPSQKDAALAFAQVATVVEYFNKVHGRSAVADILALSGEGASLERALKKRVGAGIRGVEKTWQRWVRKREFQLVPGASPQRITLASDEAQAAEERPLESMDDREVHNFSRLGELLQLRGHHKAAVVEYEKAYTKAGVRYITLINRLARAYEKVGQRSEAIELLEDALTAHPEDSDAHLMAGRLAFATENFEAAAEHFEAVRLKNPFNPEIHAAFAKLYENRGDSDEAAQAKEFLELAKKTRERRDFEMPPPSAGEARVSLITANWEELRVDAQEPLTSPAFDLGVKAGEHVVEFTDGSGKLKSQTIELKAGDNRVVVLR
ncbi:MAG: tetratricopeptide repeat protein [Myxococcota bacterium]